MRPAHDIRGTGCAGTTAPSGALRRGRWLGAAAAYGIGGPVAFTISYVVHGWLRRDEYDWAAESLSNLEGRPSGWVQQMTFVGMGLRYLRYALGLHGTVRRTVLGTVATVVMLWSGAGLVLAAVFPLREDASGVIYEPGGHTVNGTIFASVWISLLLLSRRLAHDPRWRHLSRWVLAGHRLRHRFRRDRRPRRA